LTKKERPQPDRKDLPDDRGGAAAGNNGRIRNILLIILGSFFFLLGLIGVFIPLLPTTPFLLLAAYFYLRSSRRLYLWLTGHRLFGSYINDYMRHRAVRRKAKITALIFLWLTLLISMLLVPLVLVRILLAIVGIAVTIHLLTLKTLN
jgi:uncharacterized membrane protein YbaN (DUF454 family)